MNTATNTAKPVFSSPNTDSTLRRILRAIGKKVRRAMELAGEPYKDGVYPSM